MLVVISGCVGVSIYVHGGQYLDELVAISGCVLAISWCLVAISRCVVAISGLVVAIPWCDSGNILVCGLQYLDVW